MRYEEPVLGNHKDLLNRRVFAELEFFEPSLADAASDRFYASEVVEDELLPLLRQHRLLVLGGSRETEQIPFAKLLAWLLKEDSDGTSRLDVLQWQPTASRVQISSALDRADKPTIFLFPGLEPYHLGGYDLCRFLDDLGRHGHYAILTTHSPPGHWSSAPDMEKALWIDIDQRLLTESFLLQELVVRLDDLKDEDKLPDGVIWPAKGDPNEAYLIGDLKLLSVAKALGSPARIRAFAVLMTGRSAVTEPQIRKLLEEFENERGAVHHWYRSLPLRDQVLALGLALFDGLLDDQTFSSIEILMQEAWYQWDSPLAHFDYYELDHMRAYFRGFGESHRTVRIECSSDACRRYLLEIGWILHRRRMRAALPVLESLVERSPKRPRPSRRLAEVTASSPSESQTPEEAQGDDESVPDDSAEGDEEPGVDLLEVQEDEAEEPPDTTDDEFTESEVAASRWVRSGRWRDLFGNNLRNGLVRDRLTQTLSEVGSFCVDAIEPILLYLAAHEKAAPRHLVADAVARWRDLDPGGKGDERLARVLSAWRNESAAKQLAQLRRLSKRDAKPFARVRATIALTLSRASLYDPPNKLATDLLSLFQKLLRDQSSEVRVVLREDTVPQLVQSHFEQLASILWEEVVPQADLLVSTASGIGAAHYLRPRETKKILGDWLEKARRAETSTREQRNFREKALVVIALAYGLLVPEEQAVPGQGAYSAEEIFGTLQGLFAGEQSSVVRTAVLMALFLQAHNNFQAVAPFLQDTVEQLALEDRAQVIGLVVELYLHQRRELGRALSKEPNAPDQFLFLNGRVYGLWVESERPPTDLETLLHAWLEDENRPVALQLAVECFDGFAHTRLERKERELQEREPVAAEPEEEEEDLEATERPVLRRTSFSVYLISFLAAAFSLRQWKVLRTALPEVIRRMEPEETVSLRLLVELWNRGRPEWHRLGQRETWHRLVAKPDKGGFLVIERISPKHVRLARQMYWALWIHRMRRPLALLMVAGFLLVLGLMVFLES